MKTSKKELPNFKFTPPMPNDEESAFDNLLEKFEDWHAEKEYEHLKYGTEFEPKEMFEFFKPYLNHNGC
jgi:hypothetical protein